MSSVLTSAAPPQGKRGREWLRAGAAVAAFAVWTLAPFRFGSLDATALFSIALDDTVGNLLVAVPIGWLLAPVLGLHRAPLALLLASLGVETAQLFIDGRSAALGDVLANTLGAAIGALWWRRPHGPRVADAMLVAVACWGVASRYGAPGRPVVTVCLLLALAMAAVREAPGESPDAAGFALVATSGFLGLSPTPLAIGGLGAAVLGVFLARPLRRWDRPIAALAPIAFVVETWPPLRTSPREADPALMVAEVGLLGLATLLFVSRPADQRGAQTG